MFSSNALTVVVLKVDLFLSQTVLFYYSLCTIIVFINLILDLLNVVYFRYMYIYIFLQ